VPELKAKFTVDNSQFSSALAKSQAGVNKFYNEMNQKGAGGSGGGLRSLLGGAIGAGMMMKVSQFVKESVRMASELGDAAEAIGITTDELQAFSQQAERAGSSAEKMEMALNKIGQARNQALSDPTGKEAKLFETLGLSASALEKMDVAQTVAAIGQALNAAAGDAEKMAAGVDLVGIRSKRMIEAIKQIGAAGVEGSINQVVKPISQNTISSLDSFADGVKEIWTTGKGIAATAAASGLQFFGLAPKTFDEENAQMDKDTARRKALRAANEAFTANLTTGSAIPQEQSMVSKKIMQAAIDRQIKAASGMNASDPFAAVGRAAGRDSVSDTLGTLRKIEENTRRIQPTPAPLMR
jgi:hypothetical protein